jgi:hypothetical protein
MSSSGDRASVDQELREIQATLRALTLRVATLQAASNTATPVTPPQATAATTAVAARLHNPTTPIPLATVWTPTVDDRVTLRIGSATLEP